MPAIGSGRVTNYDKTYLGRVNLARAMVSSDNTVYAQLTDLVGPKAIVETAHDLGIGSPLDPYFSIGLGSLAVNPLEMARAYATLANGGRRVDGSLLGDRPRVVERVERIRSGRVDENVPLPTQVLDEGEAELITDILEDVVQFGTGRRAAISGRAVAGKTGTTDNYGDAWFVGYTPELVVAVWVGYPDRLGPMVTEFGGEPVTGGTLPALIWKEFVETVEEDDGSTFDGAAVPGTASHSGWSSARANGSSTTATAGGRGSSSTSPGRRPATTADCKPNEVAVPLVVGMTAEEALAAARRASHSARTSPTRPRSRARCQGSS